MCGLEDRLTARAKPNFGSRVSHVAMTSAAAFWRVADPRDDDAIVEMCLDLNREDPGAHPVVAAQVRRTLEVFRAEPLRGRAAILELAGEPIGYALLVPYWSNERGGEACVVDELFVVESKRSRGYGAALFDAIEAAVVWPSPPISIELGVSPDNTRARALYERIGFEATGTNLSRRRLR